MGRARCGDRAYNTEALASSSFSATGPLTFVSLVFLGVQDSGQPSSAVSALSVPLLFGERLKAKS
jgi:hypothetical protein